MWSHILADPEFSKRYSSLEMAPSGQFSVHSAYEWLVFRGMIPDQAETWWNFPIPLKVKVFMSSMSNNKILTRDNLLKREWSGSQLCCFCAKSLFLLNRFGFGWVHTRIIFLIGVRLRM